MRNLGSQIIAGLFNKSLEQPTGGQANYPEDKVQELLSAMILRAMDGEDVLKDCPDCEALADLMTAVVEHAKEEDDSPEVKACVSKKIPILINEGYGQAQAVAVSYAMCRKNPDVANKGKEVPEPVKRKVEGSVRYLSYADLAEFGRERLKSMTRPPVPVLKEGTSEGAKRGWETRRGGAGAEPTGVMESARAVTARALEDFDEGIKGAEAVQREMDAERPKIPNDRASQDKFYAKYNPLFREKMDQAGKAVARVMNLIDGLKGTPGIDEKERSEVGFLLMRADYVFGPGDSRLQHEHPDVWEEGFIPSVRADLTRANDLVASAKAGTKKALDETPEVSKAGTSEGAKLGWETRRGSASVSDGPKEFGTFMEDAIAQRDTPGAKATKEMAENLKDSDVPLRDAFDAVKKRVDQAEALAQETFKRYGPALSKYHTDNINREREAIKRGMEVAERHVRENSRGHAADAIGNAIDGADLMSVWVSSAVGDVWRDKTEEKKVKKSGTSEGAKLGWETRRGGAPAEEPKAGMPSREKWDSMQSDADAMHDANDKFQRWQSHGDDAPPARRGADPGPFKAFEGHLNALQDAAPKAAKVAEGLKGVPGVDEEKRGKAEAAMRGFASNGVGENDTSKYDDAVGDIWNMLDDARASHDPKYAAKTKEINTMEKEVANLANALFPKWISQGSRVASPGVVKEIRKEFLTGLYKKRIAQEDVTEGEVPIEKSVVTLSRMPEAVETFAAPPANWQEGYTPIERQNLLAWVEAVDKARQTDIFRRGSMSAPFSPEFESMESRQSIGKWIAENPDPVAYYVAQNVNLASRPSVRTMKDRVVQIAQEITTMVQKEGTSEGAKLGWETRQHGGATQGAESLREPSDHEKMKEGDRIRNILEDEIKMIFGRKGIPMDARRPSSPNNKWVKDIEHKFDVGMRQMMEGMTPERLYLFRIGLNNEKHYELAEEAEKRLASMGYDKRGKKIAVPETGKPAAEGSKSS